MHDPSFLPKHHRGSCKLRDKILPGLWQKHKGLSTKKKKHTYSHFADPKAMRTHVSMTFCTPPKRSSERACVCVRARVDLRAGGGGKGGEAAGAELQSWYYFQFIPGRQWFQLVLMPFTGMTWEEIKAWDEALSLEAARTMGLMPAFQHGPLQQLPSVPKPAAPASLTRGLFSTSSIPFAHQHPCLVQRRG